MARDRKQPSIETLIDGYNLMFQSIGYPDPRRGSGALREARQYCLEYIAIRMSDRERQRTWIVFDSQVDLDLPKETHYRGMRVTFSRDHSSADELIVQAIRAHPTPKKLTVVSSDHQIQRAAKSRGAIAMESEDWVSFELGPPMSDPVPSDSNVGNRTKPGRGEELAEGPLSHAKSREGDFSIEPSELREWLDRFGYSQSDGSQSS
ncbi:YacP-like NYN domain protein [Pirellula sp. SH-Sr6A]|uniref:NYN domain-containing protein n=1 Tax=Pirellula sp. SH-Sr6A TaxID=1632865 RepID=UPI00078B9211|nr:NYN domain-containing protein [Pirellula sp. SH-Sr6A]AMV34058.1 YacP-like NYN domain protein [Pirellula sp. SH-Sr6A]